MTPTTAAANAPMTPKIRRSSNRAAESLAMRPTVVRVPPTPHQPRTVGAYATRRRASFARGVTPEAWARPTVMPMSRRSANRGMGERASRSASSRSSARSGRPTTSPSARRSTPSPWCCSCSGPAALAVRDRWPLVAVAVSDRRGRRVRRARLPVRADLPQRGRRARSPRSQPGAARDVGAGGGRVRRLRRRHRARPAGRRRRRRCTSRWSRAGWSSCWRSRRWCGPGATRRPSGPAPQDERQRRLGEQRLELAQELHDVLAHNISLINVQASVALHLLDEQPEQARPALTDDQGRQPRGAPRAAHRARRAAPAAKRRTPRAPAPRLADLDRARRRRARQRARRAPRRETARCRRCRPPSSWPPTASSRRRSPT